MTDYHVTMTGNDTTGDGSLGNPWRTIGANTSKLRAGDTMYVHAGTYTDAKVNIDVHGQVAAPITVTNYQTDVVWLDGGTSHTPGVNDGNPPGAWAPAPINRSTNPYTMQKFESYVSIRASNIIWDGINLKNSSGRLMNIHTTTVSGPVENVIVRNCEFDWARNACLVVQQYTGSRPRNILIENCQFHDGGSFYRSYRAVWSATDPLAANHSGGVSIKGVDNLTFRYNKVYNCWGEQFLFDTVNGGSRGAHVHDNEFYDGMYMVYFHAASDIIFERNVVYLTNAAVWRPYYLVTLQASENDHKPLYPVENVVIRNNIIIANDANFLDSEGPSCIRLGGNTTTLPNSSTLRPPMENIHIYNNTVIMDGNVGNGIVHAVVPYDRVYIRGNIFHHLGTGAIYNSAGNTMDSRVQISHNAYNIEPLAKAKGSSPFVGNIKMVNPSAVPFPGTPNVSNYALQADSPVIANSWVQPSGVEQWLYYRDDFNGDGREESNWSRGAIQYDPAAPPTPPDPPPGLMDQVFVATDGDDDLGDGTITDPFATVAYAQQLVNPGGTLYIRGGVYTEVVTIHISGTVAKRTTITAYQDEEVIFDGEAPQVIEGGISGPYLDYTGTLPPAINTGRPYGTPLKWNPVNGAYFVNDSLWSVNGSYLDIVGIKTINSMGKGWRIFPASGYTEQVDVSLISCGSSGSRASGVAIISNDLGIRPKRVEVRDGVWEDAGNYNPTPRDADQRTEWVPAIIVVRGDTVEVRGNIIRDNWGEPVVGDGNIGETTQLNIIGNWMYDNWKACRVHGVKGGLVSENVLFRTGIIDYDEPLLIIQSTQRPVGDPSWGNGVETIDILVCNNLLLEGERGLSIYGTRENPMLRRIKIFNNTIIGQNTAGVTFYAFNQEDMEFRGNIVIDSPTLIDVQGEYPTNWTANYNLYSSDPGVGVGANDVIGDPLMVDKTHRPDANRYLDVTQFDLTNTSPALSASFNYYEDTSVITDILQRTRPDNQSTDLWDIGAFEFNDTGSGTPGTQPYVTASFTVDVASGPAPLTVNFTDTSSGSNGAVVNFWQWYGGPAYISNAQNPQFTFNTPGTYQMRLIIQDTVNNVTDNYSMVITVTEGNPVSGEDILTEVLEVAVPATSTSLNISHNLGKTPKYIRIEAMFGNLTGNVTQNLEFSIGASDGTTEFYNWSYVDNGSYINALRKSGYGKLVVYSNGGAYNPFPSQGTLASWNSTTITINFDNATPTDAYFKVLVIAGDDVQAKTGYFTAPELSTYTGNVGFQPTYIDLLSSFTSHNTVRAHATLMVGRITENDDAAVAFMVNQVAKPLEIISGVFNNASFINPLYTGYSGTGAITATGFTLTTTGTPADPHRLTFYSAIKLGSAQASVGSFQLPNDPSDLQEILYGTSYAYSMAEILFAGRDVLNDFTSYKNNNKGMSLLTLIDPDVSSITFTDKWAATQSYGVTGISGDFKMPDPVTPIYNIFYALATADDAGVYLDWQTVDTVAYYSLLFYTEKIPPVGGYPQAKFTVGKSTYAAGENITLVNLSSPNATTYLWDFGDTTTSPDHTPTKSYSTPGLYTISLTVSNVNGSTNYVIENAVRITGAPATVNFTAVPSSGEKPLEVTLSDTTTPGAGRSIVQWYWRTCAISEYNGSVGPGNPDVNNELTIGFDTQSPSYYEEIQIEAADVVHTFDVVGEHVVRLSVQQDDGEWYELTKIAVTVSPNLPIVSFTSVPDTGNTDVPVNYIFTDTTDLNNGELDSSLWTIVGPSTNATYSDTDKIIHKFTEAGQYTVTRTVTTDGGTDSAQQVLNLGTDPNCLIGPTTPLTITTTTQNDYSNAGHTHEIHHSSEGDPGYIVSFDEKGQVRFRAIGTAALPSRHTPFPANVYPGNDFPIVLTPITNFGFIQTTGVMNNAGNLILQSFKELVLNSIYRRILPKNPNIERLGSNEYPFLSMFVSNLEAALVSNVERITGNGGVIVTGRTDVTMAVLNSAEDVSQLIVRHTIFKSNDVLLLTDGSNFEYMKVKSLKVESEPLPPPDDPTQVADLIPENEQVTGTLYVVNRGQYGTTAQRWLAGTLVIALGSSRIEMYGAHSIESRIGGGGPLNQGVGPAIAVTEQDPANPTGGDVTFLAGEANDKYGITSQTNITAIGKEDEPHILVANGNIYLRNLPTSNPGGSGILWIDSGVLKVT